jgi:hypothetical protein
MSLGLLSIQFLHAQEVEEVCTCYRAEYYAPIGVMIDHSHDKGKWMISFRNMNMFMKNYRTGHANLSLDQVYQNYPMANTKMNMNMTMGMVMYGLSDKVNLMVMGQFIHNNMTMSMATNGSHMHMMSNEAMSSVSGVSALGDTKVYGLYSLRKTDQSEWLLSAGVNIPTGSISRHDNGMMGQDVKLSYFMQPGSGSFSVLPGLTYTGHTGSSSWGAQLTGDVKTNKNSSGYRLGNQISFTSWYSHHWLSWLATTIRAEGVNTGSIQGFDPALAVWRTTAPEYDTNNSGGFVSTLYAGLNLHRFSGSLKGLTLAAEFGLPVYQYVNGIQLKTASIFYGGIHYAF